MTEPVPRLEGMARGVEIHDVLWELSNRVMRAHSAREEDLVRKVAATFLPWPLRWALRYPRALASIYRVRPAWRPMLTYGADFGDSGHMTLVSGMRDASGVLHVVSTHVVS